MSFRAKTQDFDEIIDAPIVVAGSGVAGLCAALTSVPNQVHLLTKGSLWTGANSFWAQGGIAAAVGKSDSAKSHAADTIAAGAGLTDPEVARMLTDQASQAIDLLARIGTKFDLDGAGGFALAREAAHEHPRVLHANRDATGSELMRALATAVEKTPEIHVHSDTFACEIVRDESGRVAGLIAKNGDRLILFRSQAVVLATGGIGALYRYTTNPNVARGEGLAIAARAGARLTDLEFIQFHPTALLTDQDPLPLLSEALRGAGAKLVDENGYRFMLEIDERGELAPRDVVARAVWSQLARGNKVFLDTPVSLGERFPEEFPNIYRQTMQFGIDPTKQNLPVVPAAHYHMGGIDVDLSGRSSLRGLWACGEVASTGVHGANRLASNSLLEAVVFGAKVAQDISDSLTHFEPGTDWLVPVESSTIRSMANADPQWDDTVQLRQRMWDHVGLVRDAVGLKRAVTAFSDLVEHGSSYAILNRALVCKMIAEVALAREESRGAHYRTDFPEESDAFRRHSVTAWDQDLRASLVGFEGRLVTPEEAVTK